MEGNVACGSRVTVYEVAPRRRCRLSKRHGCNCSPCFERERTPRKITSCTRNFIAGQRKKERGEAYPTLLGVLLAFWGLSLVDFCWAFPLCLPPPSPAAFFPSAPITITYFAFCSFQITPFPPSRGRGRSWPSPSSDSKSDHHWMVPKVEGGSARESSTCSGSTSSPKWSHFENQPLCSALPASVVGITQMHHL